MFEPIDNTPKVAVQEEDMADLKHLMSRYEELFREKLKQTAP